MLLCLHVLIKVYLKVPDLLIISGDSCGPTLTQVDHLLRSTFLVTPFKHVSFKIEVSLLISIKVAFLLKKALDGDFARVYGHRLLELLWVVSRKLRSQIILLLMLRVRGELAPTRPHGLGNFNTHL